MDNLREKQVILYVLSNGWQIQDCRDIEAIENSFVTNAAELQNHWIHYCSVDCQNRARQTSGGNLPCTQDNFSFRVNFVQLPAVLELHAGGVHALGHLSCSNYLLDMCFCENLEICPPNSRVEIALV